MDLEKPQNKPTTTGVEEPLSLSQALEILEGDGSGSSTIPFRPKSGEVYLFKPNGYINRNDWRADGYPWVNTGVRAQPKKNPVVKKAFFQYRTRREDGVDIISKNYRREAYWLLDDKVYRTPFGDITYKIMGTDFIQWPI